ncbi:MAG: DNA-binding response regulator [Alphaproteobacteria bacterium]|nr:DNA-binding response regulator [Alphaproteobacteria bacterium]MBU2349924.1 DNA-binding response regulator [Alphaproteobacteria bacterium]MBU2381575.1 DNA-binding response regulator [Alphaproteobacteria bacterium]
MDNRHTCFQELYQALMARVDRALPRFEYEIGDDTGVDLSRARIRDEVRDRLAEMIIADRNAAATRLDFFEARFAAGVAKLRKTAQERIWRDDGRRRPLEPLEETGELSIEVERAAGSMDLPSSEKWDDPFYRSRLQAAIDALPPEQSRIIEMLQKGIPIESQDPDAPSICKIEGCVEKTVRNRRDAAIRALRQALDLGDTM